VANRKAENEKLNTIVAKYAGQNGSLIPVLQEVQRQFGYISGENMESLARKMSIPLSQVYGVATFYTQFRFRPHGKHTLKVCHGTACHVSGAEDISSTVEKMLDIETGETTKNRKFTLESVACLGCCSLAPVIMVDEKVYGRLNALKTKRVVRKYEQGRPNE
jgi:NADH-quinone oxidoreductase subunit E